METSRITLRPSGSTIIGIRKNGISHFRGVKYAKARRFEPPQPIEQLDQLVDCTKPAPICPQRPSRLSFVTGDMNHGQPMDEDCLNLTITTPRDGNETQNMLPVIVWLHGGAFVSGGGDIDNYYPGSLASQGVVVINVTYRLGIFGFIPIEGVAPPNLGLMDQIEALRWVQAHVGSFGGDPARVTLAGQSAGAQSTYCLLLCKEARGLFHRAILQSTPLGVPTLPDKTLGELARTAKALGPSDPHTASVQELLATELSLISKAKDMGIEFAYWPHFGHYPLPKISEIDDLIQEAAKICPLLLTWTKHEATAFLPLMFRDAFWKRVPILDWLFTPFLTWRFSGIVFIWPTQQFHRKYIQAGGSSSTVCFHWSPTPSSFGAVHCIELPLLFGDWESWKGAPMLHGPGAQDVINRLGGQVKSFWAAFAAAQDPDFLVSKHYDIAEGFEYKSL